MGQGSQGAGRRRCPNFANRPLGLRTAAWSWLVCTARTQASVQTSRRRCLHGAAGLPAGAAAGPPPPSAADLEDLHDGDAGAAEPLAQQQEPYHQDQLQHSVEVDEEPPPPPASPPPPPPPAPPAGAPGGGGADDQVAAALRKIAGHIGHPKKFAKASQLLRELLAQVSAEARSSGHAAAAAAGAGAGSWARRRPPVDSLLLPAHARPLACCYAPQGAVRAAHGPLLFSALKAAMADPAAAADRLLSREYARLFTAASKAAEVRSPAASACLLHWGRLCLPAAACACCCLCLLLLLQAPLLLPQLLKHPTGVLAGSVPTAGPPAGV
jgi:hypothetical protein